jgi:LacI family transcriptional regulator
MATIYEVAALAQVSPATVSRVLNGVPVTPEREERVRDAIKKLDFTPNRTARRLRRQSSEVIGLIIADIENPFFTAMARGVEDAAQASGFSVVLCNSDERGDKEHRYLEIALSEHMAGVILAPATDHPALQPLLTRHTPVVVVDRKAAGFDVDSVLFDNVDGARLATTALYDRGFQRVACITGPDGVATAHERAAGWREVFEQRSPGADPDAFLLHSDFRVEGGRLSLRALLDRPDAPDAVFVANNLMSVGALQELFARNLAPSEFGVASFGELPVSAAPHDDVAVVHTRAREVGTEAARLLLERIAGESGPTRHVLLPATLTAAAAAE